MPTIDLSAYTVLIAEDDPYSLEYFKTSLGKTGIHILKAANGREAVERFNEASKIDLILMDAMMPVKDGFDATSEIKNRNTAVPILILTAYVGQESIRKAVASGCNDYLAKPIQKDVLLSAVEKWTIGKRE